MYCLESYWSIQTLYQATFYFDYWFFSLWVLIYCVSRNDTFIMPILSNMGLNTDSPSFSYFEIPFSFLWNLFGSNVICPLWSSSLIRLWSESHITSIYLTWLQYVLFSTMSSTLVMFMCKLEKNSSSSVSEGSIV